MRAQNSPTRAAETPDRLVREPERRRITGTSRTTWWRYERAGFVPRRRRIGPHGAIVGWSLRELMDWLAAQATPENN